MQSILLNFRTFQSLGILGSLPAAALILSLFCLLLYLMSRCCDRKPRPAHSITSLKVTLSIVTVLCCAAIGLGEFKVPIKDFPLCSSMTQRKVFLQLHVKTLFLSLARTYKQHKFPFNSMNHAHNHLHDSSSSSLSRRQIKFDLILPPTTRNRKNSILTFCRIVWKRRLAQWTARSVDSWKEG